MFRSLGLTAKLALVVALIAPTGCGPDASDNDIFDSAGDDDNDDGTGGDDDGRSDTTGDGDGDSTGDGTDTGGTDTTGDPEVPDPPPSGFVYAHTNRELYRIYSDTLEIEMVGSIRFSDGINQMTDLAIDRQGNMVGISFREIYSVDKDTARATLIASLDRAFNGLSFIPRGRGEALVGTAQDGTLFEIDPNTGATSEIGAFGEGIGSSGDVVGVFDLGTLGTATRDDWAADHLVRISETTGEATDIADTGVTGLFGLGFWGDQLYGFAESGEFVVIDASTGETKLIEQTGITWWGAAVTTSAPVIMPQ